MAETAQDEKARPQQMREQVLLEMYKEQVTHGRHTEVQRLEVTKFLVALSATLVGVMGALKFSIHCLPLCITLVYVGYFGRRLSFTYIERLDGHLNRSRGFRGAVDIATCNGAIQKILDTNKVVKDLRVRTFWLQIHTAIIVLGILCSVWNVGAILARLDTQQGSIWKRLEGQLAFADTSQPQGIPELAPSKPQETPGAIKKH